MQKLIRLGSKVIALFEDGSYCENDNISDEVFKTLINASEEEVFAIMVPEYSKKRKEYNDIMDLANNVENSKILVLKGESIYWEEVSQLSLPTEFAKAVINAETNNDQVKLDTYKNFWTLMSLNPDERCRKNLFWFLNKNGLVISKCGFFVAYRNANYHHTEEDGSIVYTDAHTGTTRIKIGEVVTMPREDCDTVQEHTCSQGLICSPVY